MFSFLKNLFQTKIVQSEEMPAMPQKAVNTPKADDLQTRVQKLIAGGAVPEALDLMIEQGIMEAILLKTQWESGHKGYETKRISFAEWSQTQNRINYAVLAYFSPNETPGNTDAGVRDAKPIPDVPITEAQYTTVAQLVAQHHTEEAIAVCKNWGVSFMLTEKRYTEAQRHWHMGLLTEEEWTIVQKRIDEALLYFLAQHPRKE
jgi:hypothetical protein